MYSESQRKYWKCYVETWEIYKKVKTNFWRGKAVFEMKCTVDRINGRLDIAEKKQLTLRFSNRNYLKFKETGEKDLKKTTVKIDYQEAEVQLQATQCMYIWSSKGQKRGKKKK